MSAEAAQWKRRAPSCNDGCDEREIFSARGDLLGQERDGGRGEWRRCGTGEGETEAAEARGGGKSVPTWLMSRGMIDSPIRATRPDRMLSLARSLARLLPARVAPLSPFGAVLFIPHSRTVRTPVAFNNIQ